MKILVADDHAPLRRVLVKALDAEPDIEVVGEADNGIDAVRLAEESHPDVVIMDYLMPEMDGVEATAEIRRRTPDVAVVGFTSADDPVVERIFRHVGAVGCVNKEEPLDRLLESLHEIQGDESR